MNQNTNPKDAGNEGKKAVSAGAQKKLLWIEDDDLISTILGEKFISSNFNLSHTTNGKEALKILKDMIPDVILIDLLLPDMNGFEILEKIRTDERLKAVPVVVLSNLSSKEDIDKVHRLGAQKFLIKATTSLNQVVQEVASVL